MTITATNQNPVPGASDVSPTIHPRFRLETDGADISSVRVWLAGEERIPKLDATGLGGFDVVVASRAPFAEEDTVTVRVLADATEITWHFDTAKITGPVLKSASPPPGSIARLPPAAVTMTVTGTPSWGNTSFTGAATFDGNQISAPGAVFKVDTVFEMTTGPDAGESRRIIEVHGPELATYDGAVLADGDIELYDDSGLDVHVDGQRVYHSGLEDAEALLAGWTMSLVAAGPDLLITTNPPAALDGTVRMGIKASDAHANLSAINYGFEVGDHRGPQVVNIEPNPNGRGHAVTSDVEFDVVCVEGVTELDVVVNGVLAIDDGVPQVGDYNTSTVLPIVDGFHVTLARTSNWPDGELAFIDVTSKDSSLRLGERRVLRLHFGAVLGGIPITGSAVLRALSFDIADTSFGDPGRGHTGFAWDGYWYDKGSRTGLQASWPAPFPIAGHIVITSTGWEIYALGDTTAWLTCTTAVNPHWSMAGRDTVLDGDFGGDVLTIASQGAVVVVDFANDRAELFDIDGRIIGTTDIDHRDDNQIGTSLDSDYGLPAGPYTHVAGRRDDGSLILAVSTSGAMTVVRALSDELAAELLARDNLTAPPPVRHTRAYPGTWVRPRIVGTKLALGYNDAGQGQAEVWDWYRWHPGPAELFLDDATTPALSAAAMVDLDMTTGIVAAAMADELDIIDVTTPAISAHPAASLGLTTLVAVSLEANFQVGLGNVFVADAARVVRLTEPTNDVVIVEDGVAVTNLSALGISLHHGDGYVRTSMEIT